MQIRLLSPFQFYKANQIVSLAIDWERYLIRTGQATYDLTGGIPYVAPAAARRLVPASLVLDGSGVILGVEGQGGNLIPLGGSASAPGAPTGFTLTAGAGAVVAAFSAPSSNGGSAITGYIVTLSNGDTGIGSASPITVATAGGVAVTATVKAINAVAPTGGPASAVSNSVTPTVPVAPVAPAVLTQAAITGAPKEGVPLAITGATFSGTPTPTVSRVIRMDGVLVASGDQTTGYTPPTGSAAKVPTVTETASNGVGTAAVSTAAGAAVVSSGPVATLRQVATGTFLSETIDATNQHGAFSYPFTNKVALAPGAEVSIKFANIVLLNGVETNGTGVFTIKDLAVEINGATYPATLTKATAAGGEIAEAKLVLPVALPVGIFRMNYALSDTGGLRLFPWFTHKATPASKSVVGATSAPTDQVNVVGGGTLNAVAAGQSFAVLPTAIDAVHAGKVCALMGSSTGTGRSDTTAPGAGVQSYITRGVDAAGFPVKNLALSGDRAELQRVGGAFRVGQLYGATHVVLVTGGNDIRGQARTAAQTWADVNAIIDQILAASPSIKIAVVVLTPVVTGDPAFVSSQTPHATNGVRVQYNTGLVSNSAIPKAHKIINVNTVVENVADPENGRFQPNYTTDGTHVNSTGCLAASQMPDWANFMAS